MSRYGKHHPNGFCSSSIRSSRTNSNNGVQLTNLNNQNVSRTQPTFSTPQTEQKTSRSVMAKATIRLVDAIFPQVGSTHRTFRFIWILIYIGLMAVFGVYLNGIIRKYLSYPTTTEMTIETVSSLDFPAVTICNENPIPKSMINRFRKYSDFQSLDSYTEAFLSYSADGLYQYLNATGKNCPKDYFPCVNDGICIPLSWVCDNVSHCDDKSDENKQSPECKKEQQKRESQVNNSRICVPGYMECKSASKVELCAKKCDGVRECYDKNDEDIDCNNTNLLEAEETPQFIGSPNYPNNYPNNLRWYRVIKTDDAKLQVQLTVLEGAEFETDNDDYCYFDFLYWVEGELTEQDIMLADANGRPENAQLICPSFHQNNDPIDTQSNTVTLVFHTDKADTARGFNISYQAIPIDSGLITTKVPEDDGDGYQPDGQSPISNNNGAANSSKFEANFDNFTDDYFSVYKRSTEDDYSDFRQAVMFDETSLQLYGHKLFDFIVQCSFDDKKCNEAVEGYFKEYTDPMYGKCFTFNSYRDHKSLVAKRAGSRHGLKLTLFIDADEYIGLLAPNLGARIAIHDPTIEPIMATQSIAVLVGEASFLDIRAQYIERMGKNYSKCWNDWPDFLQLSSIVTQRWNYSSDSCLKYCSLSYVARECKCIDSYDKHFSNDPRISNITKQCSRVNSADRGCRETVYDKIGDGTLECDCRTDAL